MENISIIANEIRYLKFLCMNQSNYFYLTIILKTVILSLVQKRIITTENLKCLNLYSRRHVEEFHNNGTYSNTVEELKIKNVKVKDYDFMCLVPVLKFYHYSWL